MLLDLNDEQIGNLLVLIIVAAKAPSSSYENIIAAGELLKEINRQAVAQKEKAKTEDAPG